MGKLKNKVFAAGIGTIAGMGSLMDTWQCNGGHCLSCFSCLGAGAGVIALVIVNRIRNRKKKNTPPPMPEEKFYKGRSL